VVSVSKITNQNYDWNTPNLKSRCKKGSSCAR